MLVLPGQLRRVVAMAHILAGLERFLESLPSTQQLHGRTLAHALHPGNVVALLTTERLERRQILR